MKYLFSARGASMLRQIAESNVLLAFDYDGTLAPIVADYDRAMLPEGTARLLKRLCELYPCAVVSGRSRDDVTQRMVDIGIKYFVGNHGMEVCDTPSGQTLTLSAVLAHVKAALASYSGVEIEDKIHSFSVHYRRASNKKAIQRAISGSLADVDIPVRQIPGKSVVNVVPRGARHKGNAVQWLLEQARTQRLFYVGDDVTDEDAFVQSSRLPIESVRIGRSRASVAHYYLQNQRQIDALIERLILYRLALGAVPDSTSA